MIGLELTSSFLFLFFVATEFPFNSDAFRSLEPCLSAWILDEYDTVQSANLSCNASELTIKMKSKIFIFF